MNKYGEYSNCYICGRCGVTEQHHVFGGSNRPKSERYGLVVDLCRGCHVSVHGGSDSMDELHQEFQLKAMQENNWTIKDFRAIFHKSYIDTE